MTVDGHRWSRAAVFALGLFTIGSQTAMLREYLVLFRGNELGIGFFFGCWFFWIAASSTLAQRLPGVRRAASRHLATLLALQGPLAVAGLLVLVGSRHLSGVEPWMPMPPGALLLWALGSTAPIGVVTGLLFPALCDTGSREAATGASTGYVAESAGAVLGGILATGAWMSGLDGTTFTAGLGMVPALLAAWRSFGGGGKIERAVPVAAILLLSSLWMPVSGPAIEGAIDDLRLQSSLEGAELVRQRHTPYQMLTLARHSGRDVVLSDGTLDSVFPPGPETEATAALLASQPAGLERAVVLGQSGYPLATALARYFARVEVMALDPAAGEIAGELAGRAGTGSRAPEFVAGDPRKLLAADDRLADLFVVAMPEPGTLLANRTYTVEFFRLLAGRSSEGSVTAFTFRSGENFVGTEFLRYGQSLWTTLSEVFAHVEVAPGETAVMMASQAAGRLSLDPEDLAARYVRLAPEPPPFPPDHFDDVVKTERVRWVRETYGRKAPGDLINRDERPIAPFLYLMTILRQTGSGGAGTLWAIRENGVGLAWAFLVLLLLVVLRQGFWSVPARSGHASTVMMAVGGGASMSASVALLAAFQSRVGAVYGEVGAATGVFMAGLGLGAYVSLSLSGRLGSRGLRGVSVGTSGLFALLLAAAPHLIAATDGLDAAATRVLFGSMFLALGLVTGAFWPIAARLASDGAVAQRLEAADHWGAAAGAAVTGVFVVAVFGLRAAFTLLSGLFGVALAAIVLEAWLGSPRGTAFLGGRIGRALSYRSLPYGSAAGLLVFVALGALLIVHAARPPDRGMNTRIEDDVLRSHEDFDSQEFHESPFDHHRLKGVDGTDRNATAVATLATAPDVKGYGGPLNILLSVDDDGIIRRSAVLAHHETPSYVTGLPAYLHSFEGRDVRRSLSSASTGDLDAMTGATVTREAALRALDLTRRHVAEDILGIEAETDAPSGPWYSRLLDWKVLYVLLTLAGVAAVHLWGTAAWRLAFLLVSLAVGGVAFNVQLSASWLQALGRGDLPAFGANAPLFLLTAGFLTLGVLFGPVYCAHACPFGALQEVLGRLSRRLGLSLAPPGRLSSIARGIKYAVLALVAASLVSTASSATIAWDPLGIAFTGRADAGPWAIVVLALAGSLPFFRFWCRVFCPVGAFFGLFNRVAGLLGLGPRRRYAACDLGVTGPADIECLQCNRCVREDEPARTTGTGRLATAVFVALVILTAGTIAWHWQEGMAGGHAVDGGRHMRRVDTETVQRMFEEEKLSDKEARYYRKVP